MIDDAATDQGVAATANAVAIDPDVAAMEKDGRNGPDVAAMASVAPIDQNAAVKASAERRARTDEKAHNKEAIVAETIRIGDKDRNSAIATPIAISVVAANRIMAASAAPIDAQIAGQTAIVTRAVISAGRTAVRIVVQTAIATPIVTVAAISDAPIAGLIVVRMAVATPIVKAVETSAVRTVAGTGDMMIAVATDVMNTAGITVAMIDVTTGQVPIVTRRAIAAAITAMATARVAATAITALCMAYFITTEAMIPSAGSM